ncbi:MAG: hypothetical protein IPL36_01250 [Nigerium sp.]|nr:hypothetical protein [Nigerium sp.]
MTAEEHAMDEIAWSRAAKRAIQQDLPESAAAACLAFVLEPLAENPATVTYPGGVEPRW